jgi:type I restriction enzyme M protein
VGALDKAVPMNAPLDVKALLRRCHDRLHARGVATDEEDLTMDMVRILLAKVADERAAEPAPLTPAVLRERFREVQRRYPGVFRDDERITVDDRAAAEVLGELRGVSLLACGTDVLGQAYEEYTATSLKRRRGQFFTNRLVVDLLLAMTDPRAEDRVVDPAGGSGGFLTAALRRARSRVFLVEISHRLVKIAKTALIFHGHSPDGITQGDGLGPFEDLDPRLVEGCGPGQATVVLTNPPFAGLGDGRITDPQVLRRFACGQRWAERDGAYVPTGELLADGAPPELLFFERAVRWLAPGGRLGIVLPKSFLDTATYRPARALLLRECRLLAVVNCHKDTFQPHTGVRTVLVVAQRRATGDGDDPPIFMALSRAVGQDSEGVPVFARRVDGERTDQLDEDLTAIAADFARHRAGSLIPSEYRFAVRPSDLDPVALNLNPQAHRPSLNATLAAVAALDEDPAWTVARLDVRVGEGRVFKGPRLRTEDLLVGPERAGSAGVEPYYTPSAVLQDRPDAAKWLDTTRGSPAQLAALGAVRVRTGDLVITRSGTVGRVAIIGSRLDGALVSDDFVRVRVPDEAMRLYLWAFLETHLAHDQLMMNEYGAIQQHLEPEHVRAVLVPVPTDPARFAAVVAARRALVAAKDALGRATLDATEVASALFSAVERAR